MNKFLDSILLDAHFTQGSVYFVENNYVYSIIKNQLPMLNISSTQEPGSISLSATTKIALQKFDLPKRSEILSYNNVCDEAIGIRSQFRGNVVTENTKLKMTLDAIDMIESDDERLSLNLWIKSGEAIFLRDKVKHVYACCNHPWTLSWLKVNLFHKNHVFRNKVIHLFTIKGINGRKKYRFSKILDVHHKFILSITNQDMPNIFADHEDINVNIYEYLGIINSKFLEILHRKPPDTKVFNQETLPWTTGPVWIGGLSAYQPMDRDFLRGQSDRIVGFSTHVFEAGERTYTDPGFSNWKIVDKVNQKESAKYVYQPHCPERSKRKTSFAINHITKLLNNPHNFYIENILKLKSNNFHPNHIIGITAHAVFEELIKTSTSFSDFSKLLKSLKEIMNKNYFSKIDQILIMNKSEAMLKYMHQILQGATELYAEHEGVQKIIYNGNEYTLYGRADLIYCQDGQYGVIDFKTGSPPAWINIVNGLAPQIPMAMLMLRFGGFLGDQKKKFAKSGFISPKGFLKVEHDLFILELAINGITKLIHTFWDECRPYYFHLVDANAPYRIVARRVA